MQQWTAILQFATDGWGREEEEEEKQGYGLGRSHKILYQVTQQYS